MPLRLRTVTSQSMRRLGSGQPGQLGDADNQRGASNDPDQVSGIGILPGMVVQNTFRKA
ncbi:hypothetical protein [Polaromonas sp. CG9_12]|nr:hypothetical protein [Polaromonas sp. CG9_12]